MASDAAGIVGVTLSFKNGNVEAYKNGKLVDSTATPINKPGNGSSASAGETLVYTGSNSYIAIAVVSVVALATAVVVGKKVNA